MPGMEIRYKLYCSKVLEMIKNPEKNCFTLGTLVINNVDIMGIVIEKKELKNNVTILQVDDGTGVLDCVYFPQNSAFTAMDGLQIEEGSKALLRHLKKIYSSKQELKVGDTVHLQGSISEFKGRREVKVQTIRLVTDVTEECHRVFEMEILNRNIYGIDHTT